MQQETKRVDIRKLSVEQLSVFFQNEGFKPFKGKQVWEWLWKKHILDFENMTNISLSERSILKKNFFTSPVKVYDYRVAKDETIKATFVLYDGCYVEGVLIPDNNRVTACISSQVGCGFGCKFCATGKMGYKRNLEYPEIYDQVILLDNLSLEKYSSGLTNIVLMGMGEPLANYDEVINAINLICHKKARGVSPSRITLSTAGIVDGINKLARDRVKFNLAVSLHTVDNKKRDQLMPLNKNNNLQELAAAIKNFHTATNKRITVEYLLIDNFNDSPEDATALVKYCRQFPAKINIIEFNPLEGVPFKRPSEKSIKRFIAILEKYNLVVNIRKSRGGDMDAACGQLAIKQVCS